MTYLIMAMKTGKEQNIEVDTQIAAHIHVAAFTADGYKDIKVWDSVARKPLPLHSSVQPFSCLH